MAEWRKIQTKFWQDGEMVDLSPEDKYFYLYLLTNPRTTACGCYEMPIKIAAVELGYSTETVGQLIERFVGYEKICYDYDTKEVLILNWLRYNSVASDRLRILVDREVAAIKSPSFATYVKAILDGKPVENSTSSLADTVSIPYGGDVDRDVDVEEPMSGKPDAWPIIEHLNKLAGTAHRNSKAALKNLNGRLRDGAAPDDCRLVIEHKVAEWLHDDKMRQYLRPVTLFGPEKFDGYLMAARDWEKRGRPSLNGKRPANVHRGRSLVEQLQDDT